MNIVPDCYRLLTPRRSAEGSRQVWVGHAPSCAANSVGRFFGRDEAIVRCKSARMVLEYGARGPEYSSAALAVAYRNGSWPALPALPVWARRMRWAAAT
jgi:hypothetical protein